VRSPGQVAALAGAERRSSDRPSALRERQSGYDAIEDLGVLDVEPGAAGPTKRDTVMV
jgi:hypothetical protein